MRVIIWYFLSYCMSMRDIEAIARSRQVFKTGSFSFIKYSIPLLNLQSPSPNSFSESVGRFYILALYCTRTLFCTIKCEVLFIILGRVCAPSKIGVCS